MVWQQLAGQLNSDFPHVLAGPLLRQVKPNSVTVWVALRTAGTVTLVVYDEEPKIVMVGSRKTIALGVNLHIVAVTAKPPPGEDIKEGITYTYDLEFEFGNLKRTLAQATNNKALLAYPPLKLPSFALPPSDPNLLRLIQGSCRMPHAQGKDTLPLVDELIKETASNPFARPHQLLLTGDQIYADDVSDALRLMLTDAADTLLGWQEVLPIPTSDGGPMKASNLHPYRRWRALRNAGFTSEDLRGHLMSLGEYLCMYMFVWSPVLWSPSPPTVQDVKAAFDADRTPPMSLLKNIHHWEDSDKIQSNINRVEEFRTELGPVRRALANIPSYMIFDDHEVTDDWNMTRNFCNAVYGKPLGQRITRNALVAYALCQHWGNVPEQFADSTPTPPGMDLLRLLDTPNPTSVIAFDQKATSLEGHSASITKLLGLHSKAELDGRPGLFHDTHSLQYHYTVEGPGHQIIFTDTRTWRGLPTRGNAPGELLPKDQFKTQIPNKPKTGDRVLLVVLSTNAPPVEPIRAAARHDRLAQFVKHHPDVYEAWEAPSITFDRLLKSLTDKLPLDSNQHHVGHAILLSGDVHHSFASRLVYRATNRYEDTTPTPASAVIVQLVASPFKKETDDTRDFHRKGYTAAPKPARFLALIQLNTTQYYAGWNVASGSSGQVIGKETWVIQGLKSAPRDRRLNQPTIQLNIDYPREQITVDLLSNVVPDYRYSFAYLDPIQTQGAGLNDPPISPLPTGATTAERKEAAKDFHAATVRLRRYNISANPRLVGVNNFGEITFIWPTGPDKKVNHILRWWIGRSSVAVTTYTVNLNPKDPNDKVAP
jgi:hypothetical protein